MLDGAKGFWGRPVGESEPFPVSSEISRKYLEGGFFPSRWKEEDASGISKPYLQQQCGFVGFRIRLNGITEEKRSVSIYG